MKSINSIYARVLCIILIQILVLCTIIFIRQWTLNTGQPIVLETVPIDPRSLFAGDYIRLKYKISELTIEDKSLLQNLQENQTVYVILEPQNKYWTAVRLSKEKPIEIKANQLVIKGRVQNIKSNGVEIVYGIENYFVPEGEGKKLEQPKPGDVVSIKAKVDRYGNAAISGLLLNGKEVYQEKLF